MQDLPSEPLLEILKFSIAGLSPASRYRFLRSASLVCRAWKTPAQQLLCQDVVVHNHGMATRWLKIRTFSHSVVRLELDGRYGQVDAKVAEACMTQAQNIKRLRIDFVRGLSTRALNFEHFRDLSHLSLHTKVFCDPLPVKINFSLRRLVLGGSYFPLAFVRALFEASAATLDDLLITMQQGHSPSLRDLLNVNLSSLSRLTTFTDLCRSSQDTINLIKYIPPSLETLNTGLPDRQRINTFVKAFELDALPRLQQLRFMYLTVEDLSESAEGLSFLSKCAARGCHVTFGFEKDYLREEHLLSRTEALKLYY